jgi:DNA-binding protein H-NS
MENNRNQLRMARACHKNLASRLLVFAIVLESLEVQKTRENAREIQRWCRQKAKDLARINIIEDGNTRN